MKGAREYAELFPTGQYGRLYITSGTHARGRTFRIQVLPAGEKAKGNGEMNMCLNKDAVEVYGIVSGNPGWTEEYGWLHVGSWQEDFRKIYEAKKEEVTIRHRKELRARQDREFAENERVQDLLEKY